MGEGRDQVGQRRQTLDGQWLGREPNRAIREVFRKVEDPERATVTDVHAPECRSAVALIANRNPLTGQWVKRVRDD